VDLEVPFVAVRPDNRVCSITMGRVLDVTNRSGWGFAQVLSLVNMILSGEYNRDNAVIYIEDFWHPGIEMLPYAQASVFGSDSRRWIPMYAFCHAQSVDPHDFTAPWEWWIRPFENAIINMLTGVFVAAEELRHMILQGMSCGIPGGINSKVRTTGTVFHPRAMQGWLPKSEIKWSRRYVAFTSRWDAEKDPSFFCDVVDMAKSRPALRDVPFIVCTSRRELTSNRRLADLAAGMTSRYGDEFHVFTGLSKSEYFDLLTRSRVQFNCAKQDFVSYCLLDAALVGTAPLYPDYLTFPGALHYQKHLLYEADNVSDAVQKLEVLFDNSDGDSSSRDYDWVWKPYADSVHRMLHIMGFDVPHTAPLSLRLIRDPQPSHPA
jgi:hypothetical protein